MTTRQSPTLRNSPFGGLAKTALAAAFIVSAWFGSALSDEKVLISYEATPSVGFELPGLAKASYEERAAFSSEVLREIIPKIAAANRLDPSGLETEVTPGGYLLKTNASLQTRAQLDDKAADRLAASLGYVFRQYSVLVSRLDEPSGKTGYVAVRFPKDTLDANVAQSFFEAADATKKGLGGGYTAFGDEQYFLNVTDSAGKPYSGLDDATFLAGLKQAAAVFKEPKPESIAAGRATARFIGNDWKASKQGEEYISQLGGKGSDLVKTLDKIEADYAALVKREAANKGW